MRPMEDYFADEIAIDFPSVDRVVEKAREAFLGERRSEALVAEVLVSKREATFGTVVSLDVPVRGTCVRCGGRGEIWTDPCPECRGAGDFVRTHPLRVS